MMIPLCRHIFPGGTLCQAPAVHESHFCRHHQVVRTTLALADRPVAYDAPAQLPFLFAEDRASIQLNLMMVLKALNDGKIDSRTANSMTRVLNSCMRNLKAGLLTDPQAKDVACTVIKTPDGDEIAPPREAPEERAHGTEHKSKKNGDSVDAEDRPLDPNSPYADLWHLPSPEFAYRVSERAAQRYEAECAARREEAARAAALCETSAPPDAAEEPVVSEANKPAPSQPLLTNDVILSGANEESAVEEPVLSEVKEPAVRVERHNHTAAIPSETTTAADSKTDDDEAAARRFREWRQSPQGQEFERTYGKPNPDLDPRLAKILDAEPDTAGRPIACPELAEGSRF